MLYGFVDIYHCCVYSEKHLVMEELSETCRVSLQNKFEKLVHLVGIIRIHYAYIYLSVREMQYLKL
jgi:hypothetical protein